MADRPRQLPPDPDPPESPPLIRAPGLEPGITDAAGPSSHPETEKKKKSEHVNDGEGDE